MGNCRLLVAKLGPPPRLSVVLESLSLRQRAARRLSGILLHLVLVARQAQFPLQLGRQGGAGEKRLALPAEKPRVLELLDIRLIAQSSKPKYARNPGVVP